MALPNKRQQRRRASPVPPATSASSPPVSPVAVPVRLPGAPPPQQQTGEVGRSQPSVAVVLPAQSPIDAAKSAAQPTSVHEGTPPQQADQSGPDANVSTNKRVTFNDKATVLGTDHPKGDAQTLTQLSEVDPEEVAADVLAVTQEHESTSSGEFLRSKRPGEGPLFHDKPQSSDEDGESPGRTRDTPSPGAEDAPPETNKEGGGVGVEEPAEQMEGIENAPPATKKAATGAEPGNEGPSGGGEVPGDDGAQDGEAQQTGVPGDDGAQNGEAQQTNEGRANNKGEQTGEATAHEAAMDIDPGSQGDQAPDAVVGQEMDSRPELSAEDKALEQEFEGFDIGVIESGPPRMAWDELSTAEKREAAQLISQWSVDETEQWGAPRAVRNRLNALVQIDLHEGRPHIFPPVDLNTKEPANLKATFAKHRVRPWAAPEDVRKIVLELAPGLDLWCGATEANQSADKPAGFWWDNVEYAKLCHAVAGLEVKPRERL